MTNPTLERAARALFDSYMSLAHSVTPMPPDSKVEAIWQQGREGFIQSARAVLVAVLPELKRYEPYEHHGSYEENQSDNGPWVKFDDLTAILAEGE